MALEAIRDQVPADSPRPSWHRHLAVVGARRQVDSVARASSGLPIGEQRKYTTPFRRRVAEIVELGQELGSASVEAASHRGAVSELDAEQQDGIALREEELVATLRALVEDLQSFDEHLQGRSATGQRRRWFRL